MKVLNLKRCEHNTTTLLRTTWRGIVSFTALNDLQDCYEWTVGRAEHWLNGSIKRFYRFRWKLQESDSAQLVYS